jgi:hypothetical protein
MATALADHTTWEGERYELLIADTAYSIALKTGPHQVTIQVEGAVDVRFRHKDGAMGATDNWAICYAGMSTLVQLVPGVNNVNTPVIHLATGGTAVIVRVIPEPVRGS